MGYEYTAYSCFPAFISIETCQEAKVGVMRESTIDDGEWRFSWRRELFVWEVNMLNSLLLGLEGAVLGEGVYRWVWRTDKVGCFRLSLAI